MNSQSPTVSRRAFLQSSVAGVGATGVFALQENLRPLRRVLDHFEKYVPWRKRGTITTTYNYCDMCPWRCGIVVQTVNGQVAKIDGNPQDPKSRGKLCARGQAGVSFLYDPDRLKQPMIRTGKRGENKFRNATWQEALDYSAEQMLKIKEAYGPEAVAFFAHTTGDFWFTDYLSQAWGSPNSAKPSVSMCTTPREEAALITYGNSIGNHEPVDWENTHCIVLLGTHIGEDARNTMMQDFANARARGAKVIVVDPRYSSAAMKATQWLPIKPGTDTALLLAWMHVLIDEKLYDAAFVSQWTSGFDKLQAHVQSFTPEWAAAITDLPAEKITESARTIAYNKQAVVVPGRHVTWYGNDTQRMRAVYILNALLGAYGQKGGLYFNKTAFIDEIPHPPWQAASGAGG